MIRILSTKLPLKFEVGQEQINETIIKWLKGGGSNAALSEKFERCDAKAETHIVDGFYTIDTISGKRKDVEYFAFKLSHIYYSQAWETEIIYEESASAKSATIHINCSGDITLFDKVPKERSEIIRAFIQDGRVKSDVLPIQSTPISADFGKLDLFEKIVNGKHKLPLPMIFVSRIFDSSGYELNVESLAFLLAGIAYVVIEDTTDFSFNLKQRTEVPIPFNGRLGVFYPNGKIDRMCRAQALWGELDIKIMNDVVKSVTASVDKESPSWEQIHAEKVAADAEKNAALLDDFMGEYDSLESKLEAAKKRIAELTKENTDLRSKNESLQAAFEASGIQDNIISKSPVKEFFIGEQHDLLVTVLKEAAARCGGFDTRQHELINSLLEPNDYIGNGREIEEVVKRVLSSGEQINKRDIAELERVGFKLVADQNHYKFVFRGNERYWFTVSKSPSDRRSGQNNVSDIIKKISVYQ
ncbi:MAG: hypothetical protein K2J01_06240 [Clostridiales bacterium]|nr:hypothetical protein [Clostridiales bacterium]